MRQSKSKNLYYQSNLTSNFYLRTYEKLKSEKEVENEPLRDLLFKNLKDR